MRNFWKLATVLPLLLATGPASAQGLLGDLVSISDSGIGVSVPGVTEVNINTGSSGLGVSADLLPGLGGGVNADVSLGGGGLGVNADALTGVGGGVTSNVSLGNGGLGVNADVLTGVGGGVNTDVWLGNTGNGLGVTANGTILGNTPGGGITAGADACIGNCGILANVGVGVLPNTGLIGIDGTVCIGRNCRGAVPPGTPLPNPPVVPAQPIYGQITPQLPPTPRSATGSSRQVQMVDRIIRNQGWTSFVRGQAVCLPKLRIALLRNWMPEAKLEDFQQLAGYHSSEIARLRAMLAACPSNRLSAADLARVFALDVMADGSPVVLMF